MEMIIVADDDDADCDADYDNNGNYHYDTQVEYLCFFKFQNYNSS